MIPLPSLGLARALALGGTALLLVSSAFAASPGSTRRDPSAPRLVRIDLSSLPPQRLYESGLDVVQVSPGREALLLEWPVVESVTRVNQTESQLENFFYKASLTPPPASYRVTPRALLWLLFAAFVVALAVPVGLVVRRVRAWRRARMPGGRPELPPLERALRLLEWANAQPAD